LRNIGNVAPHGDNQPTSLAISRIDGWLAVAASGLSLALYVRTLAPGLLPGDSGELQTLSVLLGNTHPTGYPLYLLIGKLFTWLPVGDVAYRVNLLSAVMAALAVAGVYLAGRLLVGHRLPALVGAIAMAVSPTFWSQAVIAEVYTPGAAFLVAVLVCLLAWNTYRNPRYLFLAGVLGGLSLGVHMTVALLAPAVGVFLLLSWWRARGQGQAIWRPALLGALAGTGLMLVAFLALDWNAPRANFFDSAVLPSRSAWGYQANGLTTPFERLAFNLSGRQFRSLMFANPGKTMPHLAGQYLDGLPHELTQWVIGLAGVGLLGLLVRRWRVAVLFLLALATYFVYTFNYDLWDLYVFFIPSYVLLAILAGAGLGWLVDGLRRIVPWPAARLVVEPALAVAVAAVGVWPIFSPNILLIRLGQPIFDFDGYPASGAATAGLHSLATAVVRGLDQDAIVFTEWHWLYPYYYVAYLEEGRTDLMFIETTPYVKGGGLAASIIPYVQDRLTSHPIYFARRQPEMPRVGFSFQSVRVGPMTLYRVQAPQ
jgi:4-amino-4-deoxy-L-arabinose transferase-like glycosyltransferase